MVIRRQFKAVLTMYPELSPEFLVKLKILADQIGKDAGYLTKRECPYTSDIKEILRRLRSKDSQVLNDAKDGFDLDKADVLLHETQDTYRDLKDFGKYLNAEDVSERMSYYRTRTSLLEKLYDLSDAAKKADEYVKFKRVVLQLMEELLTDEERTLFLERLRKAEL